MKIHRYLLGKIKQVMPAIWFIVASIPKKIYCIMKKIIKI